MEFIIGIAILAVIAWVAYNHISKESNGSFTSNATSAPYKVEPTLTTKIDEIGHESIPEPTLTTKIDGIGHESIPEPILIEKSILDINQDGKVDVKDVVEAVEKTKAKVKEAVAEVKTVAKKTATKAKKVEEIAVAEVKKATVKKSKVPKA